MRYYLICIGFLHLLLLAFSLTIIVMGALLIEDEKKDYLIYKMMYCDELMIIFVCAGVFNLLVFILSAISSALTFPSKELRELYRLVALVTIVAIIFELMFIIWGAGCKKSQRAVTKELSKMFKNYGKYQELYITAEDEDSTGPPCVTSSPGRHLALSNETDFFDYIQAHYDCCGVWGKNDYAKINMSIPVTCCAMRERSNVTEQLLRSCSGKQKKRAAGQGQGEDTTTTTLAPGEAPEDNDKPGQVTPPKPGKPDKNKGIIFVENQPDCGGCANVLYHAFSHRNLVMVILVSTKIVLDVYVATSSCFILIAEAPPGKYPT